MTPERYEQLRACFHRLCSLEADAQVAELKSACSGDPDLAADLRRLLDADAGDPTHQFLDEEDDDPTTTQRRTRFLRALEEVEPSNTPARIGKYTIVRRLGVGGMGVVYEATEENPRRTIALKVLRVPIASKDSARRFDREAQVLAMLQHAGIARVYEAGTAEIEGRPARYLAMEYVQGTSIARYAEHSKLNANQRLRLICEVCEAVQHAHQRGVIHRDLKPSNVLIDESGQPKVLDFGIARIASDETEPHTGRTEVGHLLGTLAYMSPEQARGAADEVDTRTDVYALGVMCYELLAGQSPYDTRRLQIHDAVRVICDEEPTRLSSIDRTLRGDVETIIAKAMAKDKERRYASASEFAADIRRYLNDEPIIARPTSAIYQMRKFARRNKGLVAGVGVGIMLLILGLGATTSAMMYAWSQRDALAQREGELTIARDDAIRESARAERTLKFLRDMLIAASPQVSLGEDVTVRELLDQTSHRVARDTTLDDVNRAVVHDVLATSYAALGLYEVAETHCRAALAIFERDAVTDFEAATNVRITLGDVLISQSRFDEGIAELDQAVEVCRSQGILQSDLGFNAAISLSRAYLHAGDLSSASLLAEKTFAQAAPSGAAADTLAKVQQIVGLIRLQRGDHTAALPLLETAYEYNMKETGQRHPDTIACGRALAVARMKTSDFDGAQEILDTTIHAARQTLGSNHRTVLGLESDALTLQWERGNVRQAHEDGLKLYPRAVDVLGASHEIPCMIASQLGAYLQRSGRLDEAEQYLQAARVGLVELTSESDLRVLWIDRVLASIAQGRGDYSSAISQLRAVLERASETFGDEHPDTLVTMNNLGQVLTDARSFDEAQSILERTLAIRERVLPEQHHSTLATMNNLAAVYRRSGSPERAVELFSKVVEARTNTLGRGHPSTLTSINNLALALRDAGRPEQVRTLLEEVAETRFQVLGADHIDTARAFVNAGACCRDQRDFAAAANWFERALEAFKTTLSPTHATVRSITAQLAHTYRELGRVQAGDALYLNLFNELPVQGRSDLPAYWTWRFSYGHYLHASGQSKGEELIIEAHGELLRLLGPNHRTVVQATQEVVQFYEAAGRTADANAFRARFEEADN